MPIKLKSPSFVVNSCDVPPPRLKMWESLTAPRGMSPTDLVNEIIRVNRLALNYEQTALTNVVLNCHGLDGGGELKIGGKDLPGLDSTNAGSFALLKRRNIGTIWLTACDAASNADGKQLCQIIASMSGCQVVAGDTTQYTGRWDALRIVTGRSGLLDEFEGNAYSFTPIGGWTIIDPHRDVFTTLE